MARILDILQWDDFFEEIFKLTTNKDLAFVTVPFYACYDDIYDDTSAKPCTCSEAINKLAVTILKYRGKRQVNTRVTGISINQSINQSTLFKHGKWLSKLVFRHAV